MRAAGSFIQRFLMIVAATTVVLAASVSQADMLYEFSTAKSTGGAYNADFITVQIADGVTGPAAAELANGDHDLIRFHNDQWDGFSLIGTGSTTIDFAAGYLEFTVSADPGLTLNLTSLDFASARGGGQGTRGFEVYAAVNGAAFNQATDLLLDIDNEPGTRTTPTDRSIDLTGAAFQGISSITFRYYALTNASTRSIDFAGMQLNGTVVPEPASLAIVGLGGVLLMAGRRSTMRSDS